MRQQSADQPLRTAPDTEVIRSPLVGTFYRAAAPDAPPFVDKGDTIQKGKPLCILEAMKLMNEFQAEFDLEVVAILAENGTMVEFGAPLFEVRRV
jgi:acetyl-CoA carboxylase biotin carboxyl carrier protein